MRSDLVTYRLEIVTKLVKEVLEMIPGVPWDIVAQNAVAHFENNREDIITSEDKFFDQYNDSFINSTYIKDRRQEIGKLMKSEHDLAVVIAKNSLGRIGGVKLSDDPKEIEDDLALRKSITEGSAKSYNSAVESSGKFNIEAELLTVTGRLPEGEIN